MNSDARGSPGEEEFAGVMRTVSDINGRLRHGEYRHDDVDYLLGVRGYEENEDVAAAVEGALLAYCMQTLLPVAADSMRVALLQALSRAGGSMDARQLPKETRALARGDVSDYDYRWGLGQLEEGGLVRRGQGSYMLTEHGRIAARLTGASYNATMRP